MIITDANQIKHFPGTRLEVYDPLKDKVLKHVHMVDMSTGGVYEYYRIDGKQQVTEGYLLPKTKGDKDAGLKILLTFDQIPGVQIRDADFKGDIMIAHDQRYEVIRGTEDTKDWLMDGSILSIMELTERIIENRGRNIFKPTPMGKEIVVLEHMRIIKKHNGE